jgi:putative SOS response-associated peptidase YedK
MDEEYDPYLDGPGKDARIMIWQDGEAKQVTYRWGFMPVEEFGRPVSLLRSERWEITRPCLVLANDFGLKVDGKTKYRASLITKEPFFCLAGMWRPASREWPASFAVLTVEAYPDIAPYKERHVAVVRPDDWFPWLMQSKPVEEMLRPFPEGNFTIHGPPPRKAVGDLFG